MKPSLLLADSLWPWLVILSLSLLILLALLLVLAALRILDLRILHLGLLVLFGLFLFSVLLFIFLHIPEVVIWISPVRSCQMISGYDRSFASWAQAAAHLGQLGAIRELSWKFPVHSFEENNLSISSCKFPTHMWQQSSHLLLGQQTSNQESQEQSIF